jgi:hypothetical protein
VLRDRWLALGYHDRSKCSLATKEATMAHKFPHTERKLREAMNFLQLLSEKDTTPVRDPEEVLHLLSAFLSAGRSVTFVLQNEAKEAYNKWFPKWMASLPAEDQQLLVAMNDQRVSEVHKTGADAHAELRRVPITEIQTDDRSHPAYGFHWYGPPGTPVPTLGRIEHFFKLGDDPEQIIDVCRRYYTVLERLVREFKEAVHAVAGDPESSAIS